jgi:hypothetical protein
LGNNCRYRHWSELAWAARLRDDGVLLSSQSEMGRTYDTAEVHMVERQHDLQRKRQ